MYRQLLWNPTPCRPACSSARLKEKEVLQASRASILQGKLLSLHEINDVGIARHVFFGAPWSLQELAIRFTSHAHTSNFRAGRHRGMENQAHGGCSISYAGSRRRLSTDLWSPGPWLRIHTKLV